MNTDTPVVVNENPVPDQVMAAFRYLLAMAGAYLVGRGWLDDKAVEAIATIALALLPVVWGQYVTRRNHKKLVTTAEAAPDYVAQVKRP